MAVFMYIIWVRIPVGAFGEEMSPYSKNAKKYQRDRIRYWLVKDQYVTNHQLRELTGADNRTISKVRQELNVPSHSGIPVHKDIDNAFKKFMKEKGKPVQTVSPEFNPWFSGRDANENKAAQ